MFESLLQKYPFFRAVPCILCMAVIFKLSSLTYMDLKDFPQIWDKLAHCMEYAALAGCYAMVWSRAEWSRRQWLRVQCLGLGCGPLRRVTRRYGVCCHYANPKPL